MARKWLLGALQPTSQPSKTVEIQVGKICRPKSDLGRHVSAFKICFHVLEQ